MYRSTESLGYRRQSVSKLVAPRSLSYSVHGPSRLSRDHLDSSTTVTTITTVRHNHDNHDNHDNRPNSLQTVTTVQATSTSAIHIFKKTELGLTLAHQPHQLLSGHSTTTFWIRQNSLDIFPRFSLSLTGWSYPSPTFHPFKRKKKGGGGGGGGRFSFFLGRQPWIR